MKKIEAIIRESKFDDVKKSLEEVGIVAYTYWEVTALSRQKQGGHKYRGVEVKAADLKRVFISVVINDGGEDIVVKKILESAATGEVGDGKIFIYDVNNAYRIRTGEMGAKILKAFADTIKTSKAKASDKMKSFYDKFK